MPYTYLHTVRTKLPDGTDGEVFYVIAANEDEARTKALIVIGQLGDGATLDRVDGSGTRFGRHY